MRGIQFKYGRIIFYFQNENQDIDEFCEIFMDYMHWKQANQINRANECLIELKSLLRFDSDKYVTIFDRVMNAVTYKIETDYPLIFSLRNDSLIVKKREDMCENILFTFI